MVASARVPPALAGVINRELVALAAAPGPRERLRDAASSPRTGNAGGPASCYARISSATRALSRRSISGRNSFSKGRWPPPPRARADEALERRAHLAADHVVLAQALSIEDEARLRRTHRPVVLPFFGLADARGEELEAARARATIPRARRRPRRSSRSAAPRENGSGRAVPERQSRLLIDGRARRPCRVGVERKDRARQALECETLENRRGEPRRVDLDHALRRKILVETAAEVARD